MKQCCLKDKKLYALKSLEMFLQRHKVFKFAYGGP
jgi:hypothetical protein